jgi:hypothetical protein
MFARIRFRRERARKRQANAFPVYPIRPSSFLASIVIHCAVVTALALISPGDAARATRPDEETLEVDANRIIYYDFRQKLPDVTPPEQTVTAPQPRGAEPSRRTVIASAPKPVSTEQMIWLPAPEVEIQIDLPLPDVIARLGSSVPAAPTPPPAPPKPKPSPPPPKAFVPPPTVERPKLTVEVIELAPPDASTSATRGELAGIPQVLGATASPLAPPQPAPDAGNAAVDLAVVSRNPTPQASDVAPQGQRAGQFSSAPTQGEAASDAASGPSLSVPNLTIREDRSRSGPAPEAPKTTAILYAERVRSIPVATLSVPLRPSRRTIPRSVDAQFAGRNVYTIVIPIENLAAYEGDWIMWFAEGGPRVAGTPLVRAPLPFRKLERVDLPPRTIVRRMQIAATIAEDGRLTAVLVLTASEAAVKDAVVEDMTSWEFKPATRNGTPVAVEAVFEIPFSLPAALTQGAQP